MSIKIRLSTDEETQVAERAARSGRDLEGYVHHLIERDIQPLLRSDVSLAPFRREVEEGGMTEDELGDFFEEMREEVYREKNGRPNKTC